MSSQMVLAMERSVSLLKHTYISVMTKNGTLLKRLEKQHSADIIQFLSLDYYEIPSCHCFIYNFHIYL